MSARGSVGQTFLSALLAAFPWADRNVCPTVVRNAVGNVTKPTPIAESPPGPLTRIDGREYLYFVGTGYLGLQSRPEVIQAACEAAHRYGLHSATSRAGFGTTPPTLAVERRAAEFFDCEASFYFSAGYAGNAVLLRAVEDGFDAVFIDEHSHFSAIEAAAQGRRPTFRFRHRDADDLAAVVGRHLEPGQRPLVMTDGVFSVRGTIAPVADYCSVLANDRGGVLVDDAHGVGVLGDRGRGTLEHFGLFDGGVNIEEPSAITRHDGPGPHPQPLSQRETGASLFLCATLSKALGGFGGIIPGSRRFVEQVHKASHWYDGATPAPAPVTAASARALEVVQTDPDLRLRLRSNVRRLKEGLRTIGFDVDDTPVPIICLTVGDAENMQRIQRELMCRGIAVAYIAAYSGLGAAGALRIAVFATHTEDMIRRLLDELGRVA
jgi:8-amino-7-oxononanoate synthase